MLHQGLRGIRYLGLTLLVLGLLLGCKREAVAPGDPVAAVEGLAEAIRDNDLLRYSKLSLPPNLHMQMEQRWAAEQAQAPALTEAQRKDHARYMKQMMEPGAEQKLFVRYEKKLKQFQAELSSQWPMMQGAAKIFVMGAIQANEELTAPERDHAKALGQAVLQWLDPKVFTDKEKAREVIAIVCQMAREVNLPEAEQMRQLSMAASLEKGSVVLKNMKDIGRIYGVDADVALDNLEARLVDGNDNAATVEVNYELFDQQIDFEIEMTRIDGRWYPADSVKDAQEELQQALAPAAANLSAP